MKGFKIYDDQYIAKTHQIRWMESLEGESNESDENICPVELTHQEYMFLQFNYLIHKERNVNWSYLIEAVKLTSKYTWRINHWKHDIEAIGIFKNGGYA